MARKPVWKQLAYKKALKTHFELEEDGYKVEMLTDYHWRYKNVNIWPGSKKYQEQGENVKCYEDLEELVKSIK